MAAGSLVRKPLFATEKPSYKIIRNFLSHVDVGGGEATAIVKIDRSFIMPEDMEPDLGAFHTFGFWLDPFHYPGSESFAPPRTTSCYREWHYKLSIGYGLTESS